MQSIHHQHCPVCQGKNIAFKLKAEDYTVSHQLFEIWQCSQCNARFTQGIPSPDAIGQYYQSEDYISHTETKSGLINRMYHSVRKITLRSKQNWVKSSVGLKHGSILDVGCGTGSFLSYMKQIGWDITGLEPDAGARQVAKQLYQLDIQPIDELFTLPAASFDVITLWHVLEHVHGLHAYMEQLHRLLKPGGSLLIAVPNYTSLDAAHYGKYWAAYDVPRHLYHFSPQSMQWLLEKHHFKLHKKHPMVFDSFYVSLLSEKYKSGKSRLLSGGWNGFLSYLKGLKYVDTCSSIVYESKLGN